MSKPDLSKSIRDSVEKAMLEASTEKTATQAFLETGINKNLFAKIRKGADLQQAFKMGDAILRLRILTLEELAQVELDFLEKANLLPELIRELPMVLHNLKNQCLIFKALDCKDQVIKWRDMDNFNHNELNYLIRCYNVLNAEYNPDISEMDSEELNNWLGKLKALDNREELRQDLLTNLSSQKLAQLIIFLSSFFSMMLTQVDN